MCSEPQHLCRGPLPIGDPHLPLICQPKTTLGTDDPALIEEIRTRDLGLTVCPISNSYVTDGLKSAEIRRLLELGVKVSINSDDPAYFPGYMTENLIAVQQAADLSLDQVAQLVRNAFDVTWLPAAERSAYLEQVDEYVAGAGRA